MPILYSFYNHGNVRLAVTDEEVLAVREELTQIVQKDAFRRQMKDILDYRTMEYYRRRYAEEA